jgi:hypothetical protein
MYRVVTEWKQIAESSLLSGLIPSVQKRSNPTAPTLQIKPGTMP